MTTIDSRLPPAEAFAYMADFSNALYWDPSVNEARKLGEGPIGIGSTFDLVARFAGRDVPLRYEIEARWSGFVSRDTITVAPAASGSEIRYEARLEFSGLRRLLEPVIQRIFDRVGAAGKAGMQAALNP